MILTNIKSAFVSASLMALMAIATFILQGGNIFRLDLHALTNVAVIAFLTGLTSFIKNSLTSPQGTFGGIQVK